MIMKEYNSKNIRNVSLIGGSKTGKTLLSEAILFTTGSIDRKGTIENKNTVSDYRPIEHERLNSVRATLMFTDFNGFKINMIDSPGFDDFQGEGITAMRATDVSLLTLGTPNGVDVGGEIYFRLAKKYEQPVIFIANQLDHEKAEFDELVKQLREYFGKKIIPFQFPVNSGQGFDSVVDVLTMKMYKYNTSTGQPEITDIPSEHQSRAEELHNELVELAAENDEELMELYFEKGSLTEDEMRKGIRIGLMQRDLFPVFCVSAVKNVGIHRLLEFITKVVPAPIDGLKEKTESGKEILFDLNKPATAFVFKTSFEEHLGEVSFFRVITGTIKEADELENLSNATKEKLTQIYCFNGKKREKVAAVNAGDIAATIKLKNTHTGDTLAAKGQSEKIARTNYPEPRFRTAIKAINSTDDEKLAAALQRMNAEDPTLIYEYSKELKQMLIHGQGELHINIAKWHLDNEFKIPAEMFPPKIPYRETITKEAKAMYRHKKQSGGAGQFGEVHLMIEPYEEGKPDPDPSVYSIRGKEEIDLPWGGKLVYYNAIVGGVIDARFMPAILKGIMEKMEEGPLTGSYARDIRVTVYDGKMHPVDSNEISFKLAGRNAFSIAFKEANPKLLEPIYLVEVFVPEERMGDVITDLQGRRALILGMDSEGIYQRIRAKVPLAEMNRYSTALSSLTNGRATYTMKFDEYAQVPPDIQEKLLKEYEESQKEDS